MQELARFFLENFFILGEVVNFVRYRRKFYTDKKRFSWPYTRTLPLSALHWL